MTNATRELGRELAEDYDDVVRALSRMTKHIGDHGDDAIAEAAHAFVHSAADLAEKIKARSQELAKKAGEEVSEHPIATAAIAAAAVGLLGYAMTRGAKTDRAS
jgi:ElaB/YqjD/DUF883 family membrane-anchored ribosome-binding protein